MKLASRGGALALSAMLLMHVSFARAQTAPATPVPAQGNVPGTAIPASPPSAPAPGALQPIAPSEGGAVPPNMTPPPVAPEAPYAVEAPVQTGPVRLDETLRQLLSLEERAKQLEFERSKVRLIGLKVGKYISWTAFGLFALIAFGNYASAQAVKQAIDDDRYEKSLDINDDDVIDSDDEDRFRRRSRGYIISSLVPLGLGVFTTVMQRMRERKVRVLNNELDDITAARRRLLERVAPTLSAGPGQASMGLKLRF